MTDNQLYFLLGLYIGLGIGSVLMLLICKG